MPHHPFEILRAPVVARCGGEEAYAEQMRAVAADHDRQAAELEDDDEVADPPTGAA